MFTKDDKDPFLLQISSVAVREGHHSVQNKAFYPSNKYLSCNFRCLNIIYNHQIMICYVDIELRHTIVITTLMIATFGNSCYSLRSQLEEPVSHGTVCVKITTACRTLMLPVVETLVKWLLLVIVNKITRCCILQF